MGTPVSCLSSPLRVFVSTSVKSMMGLSGSEVQSLGTSMPLQVATEVIFGTGDGRLLASWVGVREAMGS